MLRKLFEEIGRRRLADELGNGRFVRSLLAKAGQHRHEAHEVDCGDELPAGRKISFLARPVQAPLSRFFVLALFRHGVS